MLEHPQSRYRYEEKIVNIKVCYLPEKTFLTIDR